MNIVKKHWSFLFIVIVWFVFSYPFFLKGKVPYSSTYQVNHFAPWSTYEQFWGPVKNGAMPDITSQIYPWKHFTIETWKSGQIPLWNPYSFAGTVHLANYQSAVLSPFNLLFFIFSFIDAWSLLVLLQPVFAGIFMFLYVRSLKISELGSLISAISFMFCGFITTWMAYATLAYAILFLPLSLYAVEKYLQSQKTRFLILLSLTIPLSFFSGHFQISLYFLFGVFAYIFYKFMITRNIHDSLFLILYSLFGLLLSLPQILPSMEAYSYTLRSTIVQKGEFIPWGYLPTFLAPDFFGNAVTRNDWFGHYAEWNAYFGVLPLFLALYAIFRKNFKQIVFFVSLSLVSILLAFDSPLLDLMVKSNFPVLSTSAASRIIVLFSFSMAVLAGIGYDNLFADLTKRKIKKFLLILISFVAFFVLLWAMVLLRQFIPIHDKFDVYSIAKSNLILPTAIFLAGMLLVFVKLYLKKERLLYLISLAVLLLISFDMLRFAVKWMPFDPKELAFPDTQATQFFNKISSYERAIGNIGAETSVYYGLPILEGYDTMYTNRYGEFISSLNDGRLTNGARSVVIFPRNGIYSDEAINFLGVKYVIHKSSDARFGWTYPFWRNPKQFKQIFSDGHYEVYENKEAFPRAYLVSKYNVITNQQKIIDTMFDDDFDLRKAAILEEDPKIIQTENLTGEAKIISYSPNTIDITTKSDKETLLLLTDPFYPGWKAKVDNKDTHIYRANYDFRSIVVPEGEHRVKFIYTPVSFRYGVYLVIIGVIGIILCGFYQKKKI